MRNKGAFIVLWIIAVYSIFAVSCEGPEYASPKPKGYFRIDLPEHSYQTFDTPKLPFTFDYAEIANFTTQDTNGCVWIHLNYPQQHAALEMTYLPVRNNLRELMMNDEKFVEFHFQKADDVVDSYIYDKEAEVYGKVFDIKGKEVACPLQFWLTDSTEHYLRASLYFNFAPNNDSLQPVIDYIREDVMQLVGSFKWKNKHSQNDTLQEIQNTDI